MTPTGKKWAWGLGTVTAIVIIGALTKDKWMPIFNKAELPLKKEEPKSEFQGGHGGGGSQRHGGGGGHRGGGRGYPQFGYGYGYAPVYYDPNQMCEFKDKSGRKIIANCNENIAISLQNRF